MKEIIRFAKTNQKTRNALAFLLVANVAWGAVNAYREKDNKNPIINFFTHTSKPPKLALNAIELGCEILWRVFKDNPVKSSAFLATASLIALAEVEASQKHGRQTNLLKEFLSKSSLGFGATIYLLTSLIENQLPTTQQR